MMGKGMEFKDYYKVLGVARDASVADIKKAYRKQARKFHPDMNKAADATRSMADINEANDVLADPERRAAYDTLSDKPAKGAGATPGAHAFRKPEGWGNFYAFENAPESSGASDGHSDFFEQLFGHSMREAKPTAHLHAKRGPDHLASIELALEDAYKVTQRTIALEGADHTTGNGHLEVTIPKGVYEGQKIRLAGHGGAGTGGAPAGDLLLQVHFKKDQQWRTLHRDVFGPVALSPWEATLGPWLTVPTPDGEAEVKIPDVWKAGRTLRLKGRGIPAGQANTLAGDLYLELVVALPAAHTTAEKAAYATMAKAFPAFQARAA